MSHRSKIVADAILVILPIGIALAQGGGAGGGGWRECGGRRAVGAPRNNASVNSSAPPAASGSVASPNTATPTAPRRQPAALWRGHRWLYRDPTCRRTRLASDNRPIAPPPIVPDGVNSIAAERPGQGHLQDWPKPQTMGYPRRSCRPNLAALRPRKRTERRRALEYRTGGDARASTASFMTGTYTISCET
jgi:hypothetical protein